MKTTLHVPDFLGFNRDELEFFFVQERDPLVTKVYGLIRLQMDFTTGVFAGSYARLQELTTPPRDGPGRARSGPTIKQLRRAVDVIVGAGFVRRAPTNEQQGQLRLWGPKAGHLTIVKNPKK